MKSLLIPTMLLATSMLRCSLADDRRIVLSDQQETQDLNMNYLNTADSFDVLPTGASLFFGTNDGLWQFPTDLATTSVALQQATIRYKALAIDDTGKYLFTGSYDSSGLSARYDLSYLSTYELTWTPSIKTVDSYASDYTQCNDGDTYNVATWDTANSELRVLAQVYVGAPYNRLYKLDQCWRLREQATDSPFTMTTLVGHKDIGAKLLDGVGTAGAVRNPRGLAFAAGKLWFVDRSSNNILVVRSYDLSTQITTTYGNVDDSSSSRGLTTSYQSTHATSGLLLSEFALATSNLGQIRTVPFQTSTAAESRELFLMFDRNVVLLVDSKTTIAYKVWPPSTGVLSYTIKDVKSVADDNTILILADRGSYLSWEKVAFNWAITTEATTTISTATVYNPYASTTPVPTVGASSSASASNKDNSDSDSDDSSAGPATTTTTAAPIASSMTSTTTSTAQPTVTSPPTPPSAASDSASGSAAYDDDDGDTVIINVYLGNGAANPSSYLAATLLGAIISLVFLL